MPFLYTNSFIPDERIIPSTGDVLDINKGGLWQISGKNENQQYPAHHPDNQNWYYAFAYGTSSLTMIIAIATHLENAYFGVKRGNELTWKQITVTA